MFDALKAGDERAYRYFANEQKKHCIDYVQRNSGSEEDGKDHFQDTMAVFISNIQSGDYQYQEGATIGTYFNSIRNNAWMAKLRSRKRKLIDTIAAENLPDEELLPDDDDTENRLYVMQANDTLGPDCRQILHLYYVEELQTAAIAPLIGLTHGSTRNRLSTCRGKLKDAYWGRANR